MIVTTSSPADADFHVCWDCVGWVFRLHTKMSGSPVSAFTLTRSVMFLCGTSTLKYAMQNCLTPPRTARPSSSWNAGFVPPSASSRRLAATSTIVSRGGCVAGFEWRSSASGFNPSSSTVR